ncbi:cell wall-binding repeat-containing protein [Peptacetobacter hiranonis]|uniref:cell wall-binding repeat-containing protein n=1 Tax=Peptacetobacter hiranonis TaxID=89152 RepID=UPI0022E346DE|nr:cell wall-binding repeat-containing protein [Peptacetobacter hiranonis]
MDPNNTSEQQIQIKYSGKDYYSESDISNKKFYLGRIVINESISYTGSEITESDILSSCSNGTVTLEYYQENSENEWVLLDNPPTNVGSYKVKATLEPSSNNYTKAIMEKEFEITKANSEVKITTSSLDKEYDGEVVNNPDYTTSIKDGKVTITWQKNIGTENEPNWVDLKEGAPKEAGSYQVVVELEGNSNYNSSSAILGFNISKANNDWSQALSIDGWTYGQDAKSPTATAKFGDVVFTYSNGENGTYVTEVPKNAGTYWVKATVEGTENYTGLESKVSFEIAQATGSIDFKDGAKLDKIYDGNAVAITDNHIEKSDSTGAVTFTFEKKVANGWKKTEAPSEVGTYRVKASLAEDNNYTSATSQYLEFTIYAKAPEVTEDNENIASSTDRIEVNTETEKDKKIYLYCTDSKDVPPPPEISTASLESVEVKAGEWQEVTGEKMIFTGLKSNTTYYVWKYDNTDPSKPKEEKLENIYAIKTDTPSTPSIPSIPDEKPGIGVDIDIVDKIAGETRYDTSVSISQKVFPSKSEKVYLVSGEKFPDALSSAALAGKGDGPILLINDKNIDKILSEIDRLDAKEIVFVGGSSISVANKEKVEKFAKENSSVVSAFVGEDRYETAVKVAEQTISKYGNKGKVIIADGRNYPDSVSIAPYAAKEGIPVILVNGNKVPDDVKSFLNKYKISNAIIVGGDKAVGKDVEKLFKSVDRVAGDDRYDTSKKIAEKFFDDSDTIFMASGEDFADSISVSYYAGMEKAPVLLTKSNSLDDSTREYLNSNKNKDYIIVGGDKAINPDLFK